MLGGFSFGQDGVGVFEFGGIGEGGGVGQELYEQIALVADRSDERIEGLRVEQVIAKIWAAEMLMPSKSFKPSRPPGSDRPRTMPSTLLRSR